MDLIDRLLRHDEWLTRRFLASAAVLSDAELDREVLDEDPDGITERTLRGSLNRLIFTREMWFAGLTGRQFEPDSDDSVEGMVRRLDAIAGPFEAFTHGIAANDRWDETFDNTACDPPERFTFGSAFAHIITFQAYRRRAALEALRRLGVTGLDYGDPVTWERELA
jgi:uncharacterized damage-inducible protein DinB